MTDAIKEYDKETKLYYLNARMYDPLTSRFLQEDTVSGDPNDPLSLNLYTYCHNEPIMYTDPTGNVEVGLRKIVEDAGGEVYWIASKGYAIASVNGRVRFFWPTYNATLKNDNKMYVDSEDFDQAFHTESQYIYGSGRWDVKNVSDAEYYRPSNAARTFEHWEDAGCKMTSSLPVSGSELEPSPGYNYFWSANCYSYALNLHKYPDGKDLPVVGLFGNRGGEPGNIAYTIYQEAFIDFSDYITTMKLNKHEKLSEDEKFVKRVLDYQYREADKNGLHENYDNVLKCVEMDAEALGLKFKAVKKDEIPVEGTYKCIVKVDGLHFKRQDPDGFWSEKLGGLPIGVNKRNYDPEMNNPYANYYYFVIGSLNIRGVSQITK